MKRKTRCPDCNKVYDGIRCINCHRIHMWDSRFKIDFMKRKFPPRLQNDLEHINMKVNSDVVNEIRSGRWLLLNGATGSGKTLLSASIMMASMKMSFVDRSDPQPKDHLFVTAQDMVERIKSHISDKEHENSFTYFAQSPFLVLDDLGAMGKHTDWALDIFYAIFNHRYEYLLPTVFSTNLNSSEFEDIFGSRAVSRLNYMSRIMNLGNIDKREKSLLD